MGEGSERMSRLTIPMPAVVTSGGGRHATPTLLERILAHPARILAVILIAAAATFAAFYTIGSSGQEGTPIRLDFPPAPTTEAAVPPAASASRSPQPQPEPPAPAAPYAAPSTPRPHPSPHRTTPAPTRTSTSPTSTPTTAKPSTTPSATPTAGGIPTP